MKFKNFTWNGKLGSSEWSGEDNLLGDFHLKIEKDRNCDPVCFIITVNVISNPPVYDTDLFSMSALLHKEIILCDNFGVCIATIRV
jgi:hypothetical protein